MRRVGTWECALQYRSAEVSRHAQCIPAIGNERAARRVMKKKKEKEVNYIVKKIIEHALHSIMARGDVCMWICSVTSGHRTLATAWWCFRMQPRI